MSTTPHPAPALLSHADGTFLREGRPHRVLAGTLHYFRVHPGQWADRLARLAAMGLNTVDTYIAWNFHEPRRGEHRFDGPYDVERFIGLAADAGLDVIARPGPYICAEWDNGGLPAWLTDRPGMRLRSSYAPYLDEVARWFDVLVPRLAALQASRGGPVVAVQVENEYGSCGDDHAYMRWVHDALTARGITELRYTADGPTELMLDGGTLPGVLATATFGSRADRAAALLRSRRQGEPFMCAEFWNGWFDHWGEKHHTRSTPSAVDTLAGILAEGGSVSLYPAHGGTNFGLWAGANHADGALQPTVTSYDSDAPIAEHGALTPKFHAMRELLLAATGAPGRPLPKPAPLLAPRSLPVALKAPLLDTLASASAAVTAADPLSFGQLALASGLVLYRARPVLPPGRSELTVTGLHDRAQVFADGRPVGVLDRETASLPLEGASRAVHLELLVENQGRINYGHLLGQGKGILGDVRIERRRVHHWAMHPLPLDAWTAEDLATATDGIADTDTDTGTGTGTGTDSAAAGSGFVTAEFTAEESRDTFLAFPGFRKGFVWINGFLLGRYWNIGPQTTLYVPAPLVEAGRNTLTVLELERFGDRVELRTAPELGPCEEYIETFS